MKIVQALDYIRHRRLQVEVSDDDFLVGDWILLKALKETLVAQVITPARTVPNAKADDTILFKQKLVDRDIKEFLHLQEGAPQRVTKAREIVQKKGVKMHFFDSRIGWKNQITAFFFTSDNPVDFRDILGDLNKAFLGRIHLERVSPRDRARIIGGVGSCGRAESCCQFTNFCTQKVSLDAVRDQGIMINNNAKIFGVHGKIKSCMLFEVDDYRSLRKYLPHIRQEVKMGDKIGRVLGLDILNLRVKVLFPETDVIDFIPVEELDYPNKKNYLDEGAISFEAYEIDRESVGI